MEEKLLAALDLSEGEIRLYRAVMNAGQIAPADLAKAAAIKRTTAYSMARGLVEKGLLLEDGTRRPRVFMLAGPEDLQGAIETEKKRSEERQELLAKLGEAVSQANAEASYPVPRIKFLEEGKIEEYLYQATPTWHESMVATKETTFWGYQDPTFVEVFGAWIAWNWDWSAKRQQVDLKLLTNLTAAERGMTGKYDRRQVKYWGEATNFRTTTWICGDYMIMVNTRQKPFYLVEIHSAPLAHDQREVFRNLWEMV